MRRIVTCFDGTWNTPDKGANPTNVVKMVRAVRNRDDSGISQVAFYDKGVGTAGGTDAIAGGGLGVGLTANVMDGYRFIANNHEPGDEIYIFGFSRGAYTARSLAGLIGLAGLLAPSDLGGGLRDVINIYQKKELSRAQKLAEIAQLPIETPHAVRVQCVGVWDTVGSLGIPGDLGRQFLNGKYYFHDVELGTHIDVALHAVAIDEKRSAFAPTLWVSKMGRPVQDTQKVEQVWFTGVHSNIGGSYADCGLSDITFDWMVRRVSQLTGLSLDPESTKGIGPKNAAAKGIDSRTFLYKSSVLYPYQRIINREIPLGHGFGEWFRRTFPKFDRRNIPPAGLQTINETLHVSVLERWNLPAVPHDCKGDNSCAEVPYRPRNLAAVIEAHHNGRTTPVVGWDGNKMDAADVPWLGAGTTSSQ
jgi:hypothetical protein